jgi:dipeptide/tripeptide permease
MSSPSAPPALHDVTLKEPEKFPPTFYYANAIELLERLAHFGMYIGLSLYLTDVVGFSDTGTGDMMSVCSSRCATSW